MKKTICVIAAHPDDEVLGCGATISKYVATGYDVHVLILAEGITARTNVQKSSEVEIDLKNLRQQAAKAHEVLGSSSLRMLQLPDNRLDSVALLDVIKEIESFLDQYKPEYAFTHHVGDVNVDHRVVAQAVTAACRPINARENLKGIFMFEVLSSSEWQLAGTSLPFVPNYFVNVVDFLNKKIEALRCYDSEMRPFPHSRSYEAVQALATWRGVSAGFSMAEAFVVGRLKW